MTKQSIDMQSKTGQDIANQSKTGQKRGISLKQLLCIYLAMTLLMGAGAWQHQREARKKAQWEQRRAKISKEVDRLERCGKVLEAINLLEKNQKYFPEHFKFRPFKCGTK